MPLTLTCNKLLSVVGGSQDRKLNATLFQVFPDLGKLNGNNLLLNEHDKYKSMWVRAYSSLWMLLGFIATLYLGHLYIWAMIVLIQILMVTELFNLLRRAHEDRRLPGFRLLNW